MKTYVMRNKKTRETKGFPEPAYEKLMRENRDWECVEVVDTD